MKRMKFIAFTCCKTCEHEKIDNMHSCSTHITCDIDNSETDDNLVCGNWIMSEYLKRFTGNI